MLPLGGPDCRRGRWRSRRSATRSAAASRRDSAAALRRLARSSGSSIVRGILSPVGWDMMGAFVVGLWLVCCSSKGRISNFGVCCGRLGKGARLARGWSRSSCCSNWGRISNLGVCRVRLGNGARLARGRLAGRGCWRWVWTWLGSGGWFVVPTGAGFPILGNCWVTRCWPGSIGWWEVAFRSCLVGLGDSGFLAPRECGHACTSVGWSVAEKRGVFKGFSWARGRLKIGPIWKEPLCWLRLPGGHWWTAKHPG